MVDSDPRVNTVADSELDLTPDGMAVREAFDDVDVERARAALQGALFGDPSAKQIGRFVVRKRVGAGAMGRVYAAYDPRLKRMVALKLIRTDTVSPATQHQRRVRLLREARAMARLSHPNVIPIYEAGTHEDQVYVAMEYVEGVTLRKWLRTEPRTWREVVAIFIQAGRGLGAAHRARLVHRDFKPDNCMVGNDGRVRVLDFGLARPPEEGEAVDPNASVADVLVDRLTRTGALMGTPAYMPPEQFEGVAADARSDQFAFCVSLYEGLYGQRPFRGENLREQAEMVAAGKIRAAPADVRVPQWLRDVVVKGLAGKPEDRYPDMGSLLRDLGRDLSIRRRRLILGSLGLVGIATAALSGQALFGGPRAEKCEASADHLREVWDADRRDAVHTAFLATERPFAQDAWSNVAAGLDNYSARWVDMRTDACKATHERGEQSSALLDRRMACLDRRLNELGATVDVLMQADAEVVEQAATAVQSLRALEPCADAKALMARIQPPNDPSMRVAVDAIRSQLDRARALRRSGKYDPALEIAQRAAVEAGGTGYEPLVAESLDLRGRLESVVGRSEDAERTLLDAVAAAEAARHDELAASTWIALVRVTAVQLHEPKRAANFAERARAGVQRIGSPTRLMARLDLVLGELRHEAGEFDAAAGHLQSALEAFEHTDGSTHASVGSALVELGNTLRALGRYDEALASFERALEIAEATHGSAHPAVADALHGVAMAQMSKGNRAQAERELHRALELLQAALGPDHPRVATMIANLGAAYYTQGDYPEAEKRYAQAVEILERALGPDHPDLVHPLDSLALLETFTGRLDAAQGHFERALAIVEGAYGSDHPSAAKVLQGLAVVAERRNLPRQAVAFNQRVLALRERQLGPDHPRLGDTHNNLGDALEKLGRYDEALTHLERALAIFEATHGPEHPHVAFPLTLIGRVHNHRGTPELAIAPLERALVIRREGEGHPAARATTQFDLARALRAAKREPKRARELALSARSTFGELGEDTWARILVAIDKFLARRR